MSTEISGLNIRQMVVELLEDPSIAEIEVDEDLDGLVDSFTLVELLAVLEERYKLKFSSAHLAKANWVTFATIGKMVTAISVSGGG